VTSTPSGLALGHVTDRVRHPLVARRLAVARTEQVAPGLRRVVLGGPGLAGFAAVGVTDHVKLFVPERAEEEPAIPRVVDGEWIDRNAPALTYREYTVRTFEPDAEELVLEMVTGDHGPAARWAARAAAGQVVGVLGPKTSVLRPLDRPRYVLAVDESGLPALRNWLDRLPASAQVTALVEVGPAWDEVPLPTLASLNVTWLHRGADAAARTECSPLAETIERLVRERGAGACPADVPQASVAPDFWWAAAEADQVRRMRAAVVGAGIDRGSWAMTAYWRRGVAHFDHKAPEA